MTKLERLQIENDIANWLEWNIPGRIEAKFLELITPRLEAGDEYILLMSRYNNAKRSPEMTHISDGRIQWNVSGTRFLAGLLTNLIDTLSVEPFSGEIIIKERE